MAEQFVDWRGNPVKPQDIVLYPSMSGRSCQMTEGILIDIWQVYNDPETSEWVRLGVGEEVPMKRIPPWMRAEGGPAEEPCPLLWRAKIQPTADSRFTRHGTYAKYDSLTDTYGPTREAKPVTLYIVENITLLVSV